MMYNYRVVIRICYKPYIRKSINYNLEFKHNRVNFVHIYSML